MFLREILAKGKVASFIVFKTRLLVTYNLMGSEKRPKEEVNRKDRGIDKAERRTEKERQRVSQKSP